MRAKKKALNQIEFLIKKFYLKYLIVFINIPGVKPGS